VAVSGTYLERTHELYLLGAVARWLPFTVLGEDREQQCTIALFEHRSPVVAGEPCSG
jgi:hypothetical protein